MVEQHEVEKRIDYLMRVLDYFMSSTIAGEITIPYDETTCDGYCLFEDILAELNELGVLSDD